MREFNVGDVVRHFKYEKDLPENYHNYLYRIVGIATHTETNENLVLYEPLYNPSNKIFARPANMFCSEVDKEKYPDIKQVHRLEVIIPYQNNQ